MSRRPVVSGFVALLVVLGAVGYLLERPRHTEPQRQHSVPAAAHRELTKTPPGPTPEAPEVAAPENTQKPSTFDHRARAPATSQIPSRTPTTPPASLDESVVGRLQRFRLDMESVMDQAAEGRTPEPSRLQTLRREIEQLEQERKLLPAQARWLRLVLLQAEQGEQSEAFREQAARLTEQTNEQLARRDAAAQQALIEANEDYRRAELEIVRDYMTRDFVDEQSRQRALRQRLQELRSVYYSGRSTAPDR